MKQHILFYLLLGMVIISISSCSQTMQSRSKTPYFDGVLSFNGTLVKKAEVKLSLEPNDKHCLKARVTTITNAQGEFSLKAITENHAYTPFLSYQLNEWTVCAVYNERTYTLHRNNHYGQDNVSGSVLLRCDLAQLSTDATCQNQ